MAWLSVNKWGDEIISYGRPSEWGDGFFYLEPFIKIPKGSIRKLIGRKLTSKDKPVEIKDE